MSTNYAVAPGEYLEEWMDENGCTRKQAAEQMSVYVHEVDRILSGVQAITNLVRRHHERTEDADQTLRWHNMAAPGVGE